VLERDDLKSKCKNTPFDEAKLQGRVARTIIGGRTVYEYV
jgi:dihydroorotase